MSYSNEPVQPARVAKLGIMALISLILVIVLLVGGVAGCKSFNRSQQRADANNRVKVTTINIRRAQQQALVVAAQDKIIQAQADQRVLKAEGIRRAQDKIQATLTPLYVQFEAIEAQKAIATSGKNNTVVYVPSGTNGTPTITAKAGDGK